MGEKELAYFFIRCHRIQGAPDPCDILVIQIEGRLLQLFYGHGG